MPTQEVDGAFEMPGTSNARPRIPVTEGSFVMQGKMGVVQEPQKQTDAPVAQGPAEVAGESTEAETPRHPRRR